MSEVCLIGLGIIGSIWARHYQEDGLPVRAWNRSPMPGFPGIISDLETAVEDAEIVHICVADPPAVQQVLDVILPKIRDDALVIQSSTISPMAATTFANQVAYAGGVYCEAPFTGSKPAAEARQIVFYMGGDTEALDRAEPLLTRLSQTCFRFDTPQKAAALKLSMNLQIAAVSQALTEGWHLAMSHGLSHEEFFEVLAKNVAHSGLADLKEPKLFAGDTEPQFSVKHMAKDLGLALASANGLHLRQAERTREIYIAGIDAGLADKDFIALEKLIPET